MTDRLSQGVLAVEYQDGTIVIPRGSCWARLRCRRFGHPPMAKIAMIAYCPRCGAVHESSGQGPSDASRSRSC